MVLIWILFEDPSNANEPRHKTFNNVVCATSKASDQPAHTRSLIRTFASRLNMQWLLSYWLNVSLKGGCTGSTESTLVKMQHCWRSHVTAQIIYPHSITDIDSNDTYSKDEFKIVVRWLWNCQHGEVSCKSLWYSISTSSRKSTSCSQRHILLN